MWYLTARSRQEAAIQGPAVSVRFLDDTFGQAVVVRTPEGQVIVIDPSRQGAEALADLLRLERVRKVTVVITRPSQDSARAIARMQDSVRVQRVLTVARRSAPSQWPSMLKRARCLPLAAAFVEQGCATNLSPSVRLSLLACGPAAHDDSSVLRLSYRGKSVLYVSALDADQEGGLMLSGTDLRSSVLAIARHAESGTPSLELLANVRPDICVLCSRRPQASTISRLEPENSGATLLRTDKDGIIEIVTDGRSVQWKTGGRP